MWSTLLIFLQIIKVFLDLWKTKDEKQAAVQAETAKKIVDAFATADPANKASQLNAVINQIRKN